jgi:hypothetical protein
VGHDHTTAAVSLQAELVHSVARYLVRTSSIPRNKS